jgi:alpha-beta hydrolase superfamily lysophospholipase
MMPAFIGYATAPPLGMSKSPLMICSGGYYGDIPEIYFMCRQVLVNYGFNCIFFDGPGQGASCALDGTALRHDWEVVVGSVMDYIETGALDIDSKDGICVYGPSLGGYLVTRSSLYETRPHAYICDPINCSVWLALKEKLPVWLVDDLVNKKYEELPYKTRIAWKIIQNKPSLHFKLGSRARTHGIIVDEDEHRKTWVPEFLKELTKWHNEPAEFENLQVPLIIVAIEHDDIVGTMSKPDVIKKHLDKSPVAEDCKIIPFLDVEGAGFHCTLGARMIMWERVMDGLVPLMIKKTAT